MINEKILINKIHCLLLVLFILLNLMVILFSIAMTLTIMIVNIYWLFDRDSMVVDVKLVCFTVLCFLYNFMLSRHECQTE